MSGKSSSIDRIPSAQVQWNVKQLFNLNAGIFSITWVEKNKPLLKKI